MAQDESNQPSSIRYIKGLFKDTSHIDQPAGTIRYAKNAVINRTYGALSNEEGNTLMASMPEYSTVIGTIPLVDGEIVIFLIINNPNINFDHKSEIGIYKNSVYQPILSLLEEAISPNFNPLKRSLKFNENYPIEGTSSEQADGDQIVYWTDDLNPPRTLNITRQKQSSLITRIYGIDPATSNNTSHVHILDLFPHSGPVPHIKYESVDMGGSCKSGTYYLALAYTNEDHTTTNFVAVANPISIVPATEGVYPIESYDGAPPNTSTGKSITWDVSNINKDYKYITPAIIYNIGNGKEARKLHDIEINDRDNFSITFTGKEASEEFSVEEIVIGNVSYEKAKTISQLDGVLYLGNLESKKDLGYQKFANYIKLESVVKEFDPFDPFVISPSNLQNKVTGTANSRDQGYRDTENIFNLKGYTREEVYAFYIAFILKDGSMSYAYHIPGRKAMENVPIAQIPELDIATSSEWGTALGMPSEINEGELVTSVGTYNNWHIMNITGGWQNLLSHFFHWYDFSNANAANQTGNQMNYWHNLNEFYPDSEDFDVVDADNPTTVLSTLRNSNVRHHRFPSNLNEARTTVVSSNAETLTSSLQSTKKVIVYYTWFGDMDSEADCCSAQDENYFIGNFSGTDLNSSSMASELNAWNDDIVDNGGTIGNCYPPDAPALDTINLVEQTPGFLAYYYTDNQCCVDGHGINPNMPWIWGCGKHQGQLGDEVEFYYSTGRPNTNDSVIIGWSSGWGEGNCGEVVYGSVYPENPDYPGQLHVKPTSAGTDINQGWPAASTGPRPGWIAWSTCTFTTDPEANPSLEHKVQPLGFKLSQLKVPESIWDQTQGFRIYHAKRTHENRTVLGQNPVHPMANLVGVDTAHCKGWTNFIGGDVVVSQSDFYAPVGIPRPMNPAWGGINTISFHDFYLMNGRKDISAATHIKLQYALNIFQYRGNVNYYDDVLFASNLTGDGDQSCMEPYAWTAFFAAGDHQRLVGNNARLNFILKDKAKAYINGDSWVKSKTFGFGKDIYNVGGESIIALATTQNLPFTISGGGNPGSGWQYNNYGTPPANGQDFIFDQYTQGAPLAPYSEDNTGLQLLLANLKAFKTNLYNSFDRQDLVWTGYEVVGDDYNRFNAASPLSKTTGDIFGGDTFICRHGYRTTSRFEALQSNFYPSSNDLKSIFFAIVESTDNINFRHIENPESTYFPGAPAGDVLDLKADIDLTYGPDLETGNMKYNEAYSEVNDIKDVFPLPLTTDIVEDHSARVIRSNKLQRDSLIDTYRIFKEDQYRELPTHKGELWKLIAAENLMYFHMEDTLFKTKGKQTMKLGDGSNAYVGSGDIFAQDPDELIMADTGYIGTRAQRASIVTPFGYFSVDTKTRKIFLISKAGPLDLTGKIYGMQRWFQENIPFALEEYGFDGFIDNPITGMGFHAIWDERYNRVILTKRDIKPSASFINAYSGEFASIDSATTAGATGIIWVDGSYYRRIVSPPLSYWEAFDIDPDSSLATIGSYFEYTGWTISFSVEPTQGKAGSWASFHDYIPYIYSTSGIDFYSFVKGETTTIDRGIYRHGNSSPLGRFYSTTYNFEIEIVHNLQRGNNKLFYSLNWLADVLEPQVSGNRDIKDLNAGFTSFIVYNSTANSGEIPLEYLINTRKTGGTWKVNQFRDMSLEFADASIYYTGAPFTGGNYGITGVTVAGTVTTSVPTATSLAMFTVDGMNEIFNTAYLDTVKPWHKRGKFIDRFLAFRLICNNIDNNLINLYNTEAYYRLQER